MSPAPRLRIAYVSQSLPARNVHGGNVYCHEILRFLIDEGHEVHFLWLKANLGPANPWIILSSKFGFRCPVWSPGGSRVGPLMLADNLRRRPWQIVAATWRKLTRRWRPAPPPADESDPADGGIPYPADPEIRWAGDTLARLKPDVTIADYNFNARLFQRLRPGWPGGRRVIVSIDLMHLRGKALRGLGGQVSREAETALLDAADAVVSIQKEETAEILRMLPHKEVLTTPCPITVGSPVTSEGEPGHCLLVGGGQLPNVWGLEWLLAEVWPLVLEEIPTARLTVCGEVCQKVSPPPPERRCRFMGRVRQLRPFYEAAALCLIPILSGTGLKIKLVEALGYQRPMVTTSTGVQGFTELAATGIVPVADDAAGFAAHVVALLNSPDLRRADRDKQAAWAQKHLSAEAVFAPLREFLARVAAR